jgi:predicted nucleic acid-binding protein
LTEIQLLEVEYRQLSIPDCSCLFHASSVSARLLTGDAALRKIAEQDGVPVHGILWVFDKLVEQKVISKKTAYEKLSQLIVINSRLPGKECRKRLVRWK